MTEEIPDPHAWPVTGASPDWPATDPPARPRVLLCGLPSSGRAVLLESLHEALRALPASSHPIVAGKGPD